MNKTVFILRIIFIIAFATNLLVRFINPFNEVLNNRLLDFSLYISILSLISVLLIYLLRFYLKNE